MRPSAFVARTAVAAALAAALAGSLAAQSADSTFLRRNPVGMFGLPGIVQVPSAGATPAGTFDVTFDATHQSFLGYVPNQRNLSLTIGLFPWLTLTARGTTGSGDNILGTAMRDESVGFQLHLLDEHGWAPALAVGAHDVGGAAPHFTTKFLVASKTLFSATTVSIGFGHGAVLDGPFGGVNVGLGSWASALAEYDGKVASGGVRLFPFPELADRMHLQPRIDVVWRQDGGATYGVGIRSMIGGTEEALKRPAPTATMASAVTVAPAVSAPVDASRRATHSAATLDVEQRLVAQGFENVSVALEGGEAGPVLEVQYENRRFNRDELDALGVVMGVVASRAPATAQRMRITIRRVDLPVMTIESGIAAFSAFVNNRLSNEAFAAQLVFSEPARETGAERTAAASKNSSRWRTDLFLRPLVETQQLNECCAFQSRITAILEADVQLGHGLVLNARRGFPVQESELFVTGIVDNPKSDRLLLHQALQIPVGDGWPLSSAITQFSAGRFAPDKVGVANETDVSLGDGRFSVGTTLAVYGKTIAKPDYSIALGTARMRLPEWDVTTSLTAGRFLNGDVGATAEMARQFGDTKMEVFLMSTDFKSQAGVRVSFPLTPARELAPSLVRPRAPDLYTQSLQTTVFSPVHVTRSDVARLLDTDHEIARVYRTRDRLQPVTVVTHVERLKDASRLWVGAVISSR